MSARTRIALAAVVAALSLAVAVAPASAGKLDQQQTDTSGGIAPINGPTASPGFTAISPAQTFTPALSGRLDQVDLFIGQEASGPLTVEIRDVDAVGAPGSGVPLASAIVPAAAVPGFCCDRFVEVPFASPAPVLAGNKYAIVTYTAGADRYRWFGTNTNAYAGGMLFVSRSSPPTSWISGSGTDLAFKTYVISYDFGGFFSPVDNAEVNLAKAGSSIPVRFSLGGDQGLEVLDGAPTFSVSECDPDADVDAVETTTTANNGLTYDAATDTYTYVWKTDKGWKGKCGVFTLKLNDGSEHTAEFQFK